MTNEFVDPRVERAGRYGLAAPVTDPAKLLWFAGQQPTGTMARNRSRVAEWAALLDEGVPPEYDDGDGRPTTGE